MAHSLSVGFSAIDVKELADGQKVDFEKDLLPIFKKNCLACHNTSKSKGDLNLETPQLIAKGNPSDGVVIPGDPENSLLFISATHGDEDLIMPPEGNKVKAKDFTPEELGILKRWIEDGAKGTVSQSNNIQFEEPVRGYFPVLSLDISPDSQYVLCGRGNRLFAYDLVEGKLSQELVTNNLSNGVASAHKDLVHSIAVHPSSMYAITGDFKEVNVWKRMPVAISKTTTNNLNGIITSIARIESLDSVWVGDVYGNLGLASQFGVEKSSSIRQIQSPHKSSILGIYLSKLDDKKSQIISVSSDGIICGWDSGTSKSLWDYRIDQLISSSDFASNLNGNEVLFLGLETGGLHVIKSNGDQIESKTTNLHSSRISFLKVLDHKTEKGKISILSAGEDSKVKFGIYELSQSNYQLLWEKELKINGMALSPDGDQFVVNTSNGGLQIYGIKDGEHLKTFPNAPDLNERLDQTSRELSFFKSEEGYLSQQLNSKKKELENQTQRVEKSKKELDEKKGLFQKAQDDFQKKETEKNDLDSRLVSVRESIEKDQRFADAAKAKYTELQNQIIASSDKNEDWIRELATLAFEAGKADQKSQNSAKINDPIIKKLQDDLKPVLKSIPGLRKKMEEAELQLKLITEELRLAEQAVQVAINKVKSVEKEQKNLSLKLNEFEEKQANLAEKNKSASIKTTSMIFSKNGKKLVTFDHHDNVILWGVSAAGVINRIKSPDIQATTILPSGDQRFLIGDGAGKLSELDISLEWKFEKRIGSLDQNSPITERVYSLDFSPDGNSIVVGSGISSRSGQVLIFDFHSGQLKQAFDELHSDVVYGVEYSWDGRFLASCSADKFVRVTDLESGNVVNNFEGHSHYVMDLSWHRNGRSIISAAADSLVKVWNTSTGQRLKDIRVSSKEATSVDFIPYSNKFVTSGGDNSVGFFQTDGKKLRSYPNNSDYMIRARSNRKGSIVVGGGQDGSLKVWDLHKGNLIHHFPSPPAKNDLAKINN